jgi:hypothetical protein
VTGLPLHLRELAVKKFLQLLCKWRGLLAMFCFWACSLPRESDDRLEAKIDRLLSEAIDPAQFDDREEVQGWGLNSQPTLSA